MPIAGAGAGSMGKFFLLITINLILVGSSLTIINNGVDGRSNQLLVEFLAQLNQHKPSKAEDVVIYYHVTTANGSSNNSETNQQPSAQKWLPTVTTNQISLITSKFNQHVTVTGALGGCALLQSNPSNVEGSPLTIFIIGPIREALATLSQCLGNYFRPTTTWILLVEPPINNEPSPSWPSSTWLSMAGPSQFKLSDNIYIRFNSSSLLEVYAVKGQLNIRAVIIEQLFGVAGSPSLIVRRLNFNGIQLKVAHVREEKAQIRTRNGRETLFARYWGADDLTYRQFAFMQDLLHFEAHFQSASSWVWAQSNTTYSMADLLQNDTVDMALSSTGLWPAIEYSFLFVTRVHKEIYIYYHTSEQSVVYGNLFREIFSTEALIAVLIAVFTILLVSTIFFYTASLDELFIWTVSIFSQQGVEAEPQTPFPLSSRIYFIVVSTMSLLFYASLSAFLLTKFSIGEEISDLKDLVMHRYRFGVWENSIIDNGFKLNLYGPASPLWSLRNIYTTFQQEPAGIESVLTTKQFAYITLQNTFLEYGRVLGNISRNPSCDKLKQMVIAGDKRWGSAFVKRDSEFKAHFNYARLLGFQYGLINRNLGHIKRREREAKPSCSSNSGGGSGSGSGSSGLGDSSSSNPNHGIYLQEIALLFWIFVAGIMTSITVLSVEIGRSWYLTLKSKLTNPSSVC